MAAVQVCDFTSLNKASACFGCFSTQQLQAAMVFFLNARLAQLQGVTPLTANQLRALTTAFIRSSIDPMTDNLDAQVALQGAIAAGVPGASSLTIAQIRKLINPLANTSYQELRAMEVILRCQLNQFP